MKLLEHQAKAHLAGCGMRIPRGRVARTPDEARRAAEEIGGPVVIKAQILAGGRGKAGGVLRAASPTEAEPLARRLLGQRLITSQTGPEGRLSGPFWSRKPARSTANTIWASPSTG